MAKINAKEIGMACLTGAKKIWKPLTGVMIAAGAVIGTYLLGKKELDAEEAAENENLLADGAEEETTDEESNEEESEEEDDAE
ncbi:MAG: hypothetical protein E7576_07135 [Ruminococcaceae bacterium]|nr:hypothetical protein [Oscillospiraceae bacterium]